MKLYNTISYIFSFIAKVFNRVANCRKIIINENYKFSQLDKYYVHISVEKNINFKFYNKYQ